MGIALSNVPLLRAIPLREWCSFNKVYGCPNMSVCSRYREAALRRPLILHELMGFNADIICLQEVDEKAFELFLKPHLEYAGGTPILCEVMIKRL